MRELRWIDGPFRGMADLVDGAGVIVGSVGGLTTGVRGYVVERRRGLSAIFAAIADHRSEDAARAWVEAEVRKLGGARSDA